ncbi:FkbM family methyltransferase [Prosthecobacter sp.]|uniref:FkbM family methyltransferase n=1 Tax=Prosthecobacter sp. TaxID=1965333 RepID=UPI003784F88A
MLSTESKIRLARVLYRLLKLAGFRDEQVVTRSGVRFQLDLREGIDLSLFLFGAFQNHVLSVSPQSAAPVIFDVGANSGAITIPLAQKHPSAQIHSFEPTHYALEKLQRNLALNPALAPRVTVNACFVGRNSGTNSAAKAYASWPVDGTTTGDTHATHFGHMRDATATRTSLDDYITANAIPKVHLIKIDTDGHELEVLAGAQKLIATSRPRIVMEMCPHLLEEHRLILKDYVDILGPGYRMTDLQTGRAFDEQALARLPHRGGTDVLAEVC